MADRIVELDPDYQGTNELKTWRVNLIDKAVAEQYPKGVPYYDEQGRLLKTRIARCFILGPKEWINPATGQKETYIGLTIVWTLKRFRDIKVKAKDPTTGQFTTIAVRDFTIWKMLLTAGVKEFSPNGLIESVEIL